jgi:hypothetical protein
MEVSDLNLAQFTGTQYYYRVNRQSVMTDGCRYLAETTSSFWLIGSIANQVLCLNTQDWFVVIRIEVTDQVAKVIYEDGNSNVHLQENITMADFPLSEITLYACKETDYWVIMLPSEY